MSNAKGRPMALTCATALALAAPLSQAYVRAVSTPGPQDQWNTFTAEVTIRRGLLDAANSSVSKGIPAIKYRWVRTQSGTHWQSTMVVLGGTRPEVVTPTGESQKIPPAVARIEDDGDGTEPRFYNLQGDLLRLPTKKDRQKMGATEAVFASTDALARSHSLGTSSTMGPGDRGREWAEALVPSLERKGSRRTALQNRFGPTVGKVRGLTRYLQTVGDDTTEVLANEDWGVPIEINSVRNGVLQSHATFDYEPGPKGSLVRRRSHVEQAIPNRPERPEPSDMRMVLDIELANVTLEDRR